MKHAVVIASCAFAVVPWAQAHPLCDAAWAGLDRFAQAHGLIAEVRCRVAANQALPAGASLLAMGLPKEKVLRSGALTWPVRVQVGSGHSHVQQVPLTVAWTAPAWVAARNLEPGAELLPADLELQSLRWPEGLAVQPADAESRPSGRLRSAQRAGGILTTAALLPSGVLVRGDKVTVILTQGAMEIRMPAQLLAPSRVGSLARAQVSGRAVPLEGRLVDAQTLMVVSE